MLRTSHDVLKMKKICTELSNLYPLHCAAGGVDNIAGRINFKLKIQSYLRTQPLTQWLLTWVDGTPVVCSESVLGIDGSLIRPVARILQQGG